MREEWEVFDFTEAEAKVVQALIEKEALSVSALGRTADIPRSTTDDVLKRLKERNLVRRVSRGYTSVWRLAIPAYIKKRLAEAGHTLGVSTHTRAHTLPDSTFREEISDQSGLMLVRGIPGLLRLYEEMYSGHKHERVLFTQTTTAVSDIRKKVPTEDIKRINEIGKKHKGIIEMIATEGVQKEYRLLAKHDVKWAPSLIGRLAIMHIVPDEYLGDLPAEVTLFRDELLLTNWREETGIVIKNEDIAHLMRNILNAVAYGVGYTFNIGAFVRDLIEENKPK